MSRKYVSARGPLQWWEKKGVASERCVATEGSAERIGKRRLERDVRRRRVGCRIAVGGGRGGEGGWVS